MNKRFAVLLLAGGIAAVAAAVEFLPSVKNSIAAVAAKTAAATTSAVNNPVTVASVNNATLQYNKSYAAGEVTQAQAATVNSAYQNLLQQQVGTNLGVNQTYTQPLSSVNNGSASSLQLAQDYQIETSSSYGGQYNYIFNPATGTFTANPLLQPP